MPKYEALVACDPSSYGRLTVEAATVEEAIEKIGRDDIEGVADDVEMAGATTHRIVELYEIDDAGDRVGEALAHDVDKSADWERPSLTDRLKALIAEGLTSGEARNIFAAADQDAYRGYIAQARESYADDELEIDDTPEVSEGEGGCWVAAWAWVGDDEVTQDDDEDDEEEGCPACGAAPGFSGVDCEVCEDDEDQDDLHDLPTFLATVRFASATGESATWSGETRKASIDEARAVITRRFSDANPGASKVDVQIVRKGAA